MHRHSRAVASNRSMGAFCCGASQWSCCPLPGLFPASPGMDGGRPGAERGGAFLQGGHRSPVLLVSLWGLSFVLPSCFLGAPCSLQSQVPARMHTGEL